MVIKVKDLNKTFKIYKREEGFLNSIKSFFKREEVIIDAVKNVNITIKKGEKIGFLGPNGAGKSTTIKMMTGILHPTSGEIEVIGFNPWKNRREYVKNIGVIFGQKSQLWLDLPAVDVFDLHKDIYEIEEKEYKKRIKKIVKMLKIEEVMKRPVRNLSLGERMKCEFALALLHNPPVLFLDEPTIGVDALSKDEIRSFLDEINKEFETTFILTTHDMDDVEEICNRIIVIDQGKIIYDGDMKKLKNKYVKWTTIKMDFSNIKNKKKFEGLLKKGEVLVDGHSYKEIRFSKKLDINKILQDIMNSIEIIDLSIQEPRLESVIKEIYKK
ncbi:MAG: ABC transporter ATP-binding protein [Candidatus Woesearchaeota archaeon]